MSARVRVLEGALIDQIAAGEVVERPSSVVKELLENALDAGATTVRIEVEDGGKKLVRVADDGHGMAPEDAALAVERHATSKIRDFGDLSRIRTLGFRGEALPSIASVSRFSIATRPRDAIAGTCVRIEGGGPKVVESAGVAPGTVVEVRDLFFNVPARQKFLKARLSEARQIVDVCLRAALVRPELRLVLSHDGRMLRSFLPVLGLAARAAAVFEDEALRAIEGVRGGLGIEAMLGSVDRAQRGPRRLFLFVNGRPVADPKLARQVAFAFGTSLAPGLYPSGVVCLRLPPEEVDVNAHPQKAEVRFADERGVFDALTRLLAQELDTRPYARGGDATRFWEERLHRPPGRDDRGAGPLFDPPASTPYPADPWGIGGALRDGATATAAAIPARTQAVSPSPGHARGFFGRLRYVGAVRDTFLVCEGERSMYLIDAAAADLERLVVEARAQLASGGVASRRLLFPARVEVSVELAERAGAAPEALLALGFDVERIGPRTLAVHRAPAAIREGEEAAGLRAAMPLVGLSSDDPAMDTGLVSLLGPSAIRAGDPITPEWARALLDTIDAGRGRDETIPSGPPIVRSYPLPDARERRGATERVE